MVIRRWSSLVLVAVCLALVPATAASADHRAPFDGSDHAYGEMVDYPLVFPVVGDHTLWDTFYATRSSGQHHAQDLMAAKMTPIVAAAAGTIRYINWTRSADQMFTNGRCCTMVITHDDGWESWYLHMNNDTPGTDDGQGWGIAPGLVPGMHVDAGQVIGWVGDSGNAEYTGSHLHFELYDPEGVIVNPYQALLAAETVDCSDGCEPFDPLVRGDRGNRVVELQMMLQAIGFYSEGIDGVFGSLTETAVRGLQVDQSLPSSGIVDHATWTALVTIHGDPPTLPDPCAGGAGCDGVMLVDASGRWSRLEHLGGSAGRSEFWFGNPGDLPFSGDWDCDGTITPGLYRQRDGFVYLRNSNTSGVADLEFFFGNPGDIPVVGDFNNDGCDSVSVYRPAQGRFYVINALGSAGGGLGAAEFSFVFGNPGDRPFVGDFDGDGIDTIGLHRVSTGFAYLRNSLTTGVADLSFFFGNGGDLILAGDWNGDGADSVAVYRPSSRTLYLNFANRAGVADRDIVVGSYAAAVVGARGPGAAGPQSPPPVDGGPPEIVYEASLGSEQWRPLVEYVFDLWGLDEEKCGSGDRSSDCVGPQVDNAIVIMQCESLGDPTVVNSSSGTTGLFQHRPEYWSNRTARVRTHFPGFPTDASAYDPYDNIMVAALLVDESRDALIGENSLTGPWDDGPEPWGHWDGSSRSEACHNPPLVSP